MNLTEKRSSSNLLNGLLANLLIWQATDFPVLRRALVSELEIRWPLHSQRQGLYERQKVRENRSQPFTTYLHSTCLSNLLKSMAQVKVKTQHLQVATFHFLLSQISQYGCSSKAKGNVAGDAVICYMICQPCIFSTETCTAFYSTQ